MTALATIHIGLKQLGIAEDDARDLYERLTGERSLRAMRPSQHQALIDELKRLGFKPASTESRRRLDGKYAPKLQALWIAGYNLGLIRNRDDAALLAFVKRQTGIDHTRFLHYSDDASKAIEALKAWLARDGGVDWRTWKDWEPSNGCRIAMAQCLILDPEHGARDFWPTVCEAGGISAPNQFNSERDWHRVMNALGARIRAQQR